MLRFLSIKIFGVRLVFLIFLLLSIAIYIHKNQNQNQNQLLNLPIVGKIAINSCGSRLPKPITLIKDPENMYLITLDEEVRFDNILSESLDENEITNYRALFKKTKVYSPEAYFIIVKHSLRLPGVVKDTLNAWWFGPTQETINVIAHEYTHSARFPCFYNSGQCPFFSTKPGKNLNGNYVSYSVPINDQSFLEKTSVWIDNYSLAFEIDRNRFFRMNNDKIVLSEGSDFDKRLDIIYFNGKEGDFELFLTELNSFRKNIIISRQIECTEVSRGKADSLFYSSAWSRILYHLTASLEYTEINKPKTWEYLVQNKDFTYLLRWQVEAGLQEVSRTVVEFNHGKTTYITDTNSPEEINKNLELVNKSNILNKLFDESLVNDIPLSLDSIEELSNYGLDYQVIKY
ncbi:hypothetical protein K0B04_00890 [Patescibacteria group bacterium]|nr:hypothetical protein [Patescibacteria group bacterium]